MLYCIVIIRLLTDGMGNARPNIADVYYKAEKIEDSAIKGSNCGSLSFFVKDSGNNEDLNDAFKSSLVFLPASPSYDKTVLLFQQKLTGSGRTVTDGASIDFTIGKQLTFRIDYFEIY